MAGHGAGGPGAAALFAAAGAGAPRVPPAGERCAGPGPGPRPGPRLGLRPGPREALPSAPLSSALLRSPPLFGALPDRADLGEPDHGGGPLSSGEPGARSARRPFPGRSSPPVGRDPSAWGSVYPSCPRLMESLRLRVVALRQHFPCRSLF